MNTLEKEATEILNRYGLELPGKWDGEVNVWHMYHHHEFLKCWFISYKQYLRRILQIEYIKPDSEKRIRFSVFKPVKNNELSHLNLHLFDTEYLDKRSILWNNFNSTRYDNVSVLVKSYAKQLDILRNEMENKTGLSISKIHSEELPNIPFDESTNELIFPPTQCETYSI